MIDGICKARNKHPEEDESKRLYYNPGQKIPGYSGDMCARLKAGFLKLDIDDFDHKTGKIDDPIQGKPRSEAVKAWLDSRNIRYNLMITEHGKHFYFRVPPDYPFDANKVSWYTALGIKVEVKLGGGTSKEHIPFKVGGVLRQWAVGSMENEDIDELPAELWPLQKPKNKPFDFSTLADARNNGFSEYAFHLAWKGYTVEQIQSAIHGINDFVLDAALRCQEIDTILREETLDKLRNIINQKEEKNLSPVEVANELIDCYRLIYFNGTVYAYQGGVYKPFGKDRINAYISKHYPFAKIRFRQEVTEQLKGAAYIDQIEESPLINVRNGLLEIADDGTVTLHPHSPEQISFRQFNAVYAPSATSPVLNKMLNDAFSDSSEQVKLFSQIVGYLLMNHVRYQKCFFWIGFPSSGKSTISMMVLATDEAMSALLNLAISGYKSLIQNKGFIETRKSKQQLAAFVSENDSVVAWVESLDDLSELEREPISGPEGLYHSYDIYCNQTGEKAKDQKDFTRTIKSRYGYRQCKRRIAGKQYPFFVK